MLKDWNSWHLWEHGDCVGWCLPCIAWHIVGAHESQFSLELSVTTESDPRGLRMNAVFGEQPQRILYDLSRKHRHHFWQSYSSLFNDLGALQVIGWIECSFPDLRSFIHFKLPLVYRASRHFFSTLNIVVPKFSEVPFGSLEIFCLALSVMIILELLQILTGYIADILPYY